MEGLGASWSDVAESHWHDTLVFIAFICYLEPTGEGATS